MAMSPQGRVSFPSVFQATAMEDSKPKFSLCLLFKIDEMEDGQKSLLKEMKAAAEAAAQEKFGVGLGEEYRGKELRSPFRKSEEKPEYMPPGHIFVRFSSLTKPGLVDPSRDPITEDSGDFYAGCWAHVTYTVYAYDKGGNRGVAFGLKNIQKTKDDESFGTERTSPDDDFEVLEAATAADDIAF